MRFRKTIHTQIPKLIVGLTALSLLLIAPFTGETLAEEPHETPEEAKATYCMSGVCLGQRMAELSDIPWTGHETPRAIGPIKLVGYSTEWDDRMALVQNRRRAALDVSELVRLLEPVHTLCWGFGVTLTLTDETTATFSAVPNPTGWQGYQVVKLTRMEVPEAGPEDWIEERRAEYDALYDIRDKKNLKAIDGGYVAAYRFEKKKNQGSVKFSLIDAAGHAVGKRLRHKSASATLDDHPNCNGRRPETFHWD